MKNIKMRRINVRNFDYFQILQCQSCKIIFRNRTRRCRDSHLYCNIRCGKFERCRSCHVLNSIKPVFQLDEWCDETATGNSIMLVVILKLSVVIKQNNSKNVFVSGIS